MSNSKYQATAQRDSFEDDTAHYSQAPPSYVDRTSADEARLLGAPRSSEDNIPDDFKVCMPECVRPIVVVQC